MCQAAHLVGLRHCVLVVLSLVLAGAPGVILVGRSAVCPAVPAALLFPGGVCQHLQGGLFLHGGDEGTHFA